MSSYPTDDGASRLDTPIYDQTVGGTDVVPPLGESGLGDTTTSGSTPNSAAGAKADAAREQAHEVGSNAKQATQQVAGTAKAQAARVTGEARGQARQLLGQAQTELSDQAKTQQQRVAQGVRTFSDELTKMGESSSGLAGELVHTVAQRAQGAASWLENREPQDVLREVRRFAARRPGLFLVVAGATGVVAARLTKALVAESKASSDTAASGTYASAGTTSYGTTPSYDATSTYGTTDTVTGTGTYTGGAATGGAGYTTGTTDGTGIR